MEERIGSHLQRLLPTVPTKTFEVEAEGIEESQEEGHPRDRVMLLSYLYYDSLFFHFLGICINRLFFLVFV